VFHLHIRGKIFSESLREEDMTTPGKKVRSELELEKRGVHLRDALLARDWSAKTCSEEVQIWNLCGDLAFLEVCWRTCGYR
jgi:hypothetical protein